MKYFITGIAGFLGSHLAEQLIKDGHEVAGCDNLVGGDIDNIPAGVKFHKADCTDTKKMNRLTKGMDVVYHCAAHAHEGLSIFSPEFITRNTFGSSMSVISAALSNSVKRFVLCSSASRYGEIETPYTEDMHPKPQDPYGIAKYASDLALINLATTHGMEYSIAVPHNIIGTRQKYDDPYRNVASIFINRMLQGKPPMIYGDGLQERSFSFISDVVNPMIKMGTAPEANGHIINVGPDKGTTTIKELANIIAELTDFKGKFIHIPDRPSEVKVTHCSADKARSHLGYESTKDLKEGLEEMVAWIKQKGVKPFKYTLPIEIDSPLLPVTWREKRI